MKTSGFMQVMPGHLKSAELVHKETAEARRREAEKTWKYIEDKINFASRNGRYEVDFEGQIDEHTIEVLKELGYKVKVDKGDIDDYGYFYPANTKISWKKIKKRRFKT